MRYGIEDFSGNDSAGDTTTFHIACGTGSYVLEVMDGRWVNHCYWGGLLPPGNCGGTNGGGANGHTAEGRTAEYLTTWGVQSRKGYTVSPDLLLREYPSWGTGEMRAPAWSARRPDGSLAGDLWYHSHQLFRGADAVAKRPEGLPWVHPVGDAGDFYTLQIDCRDPAGGVQITLFYSVAEGVPVLLRWCRLVNRGSAPLEVRALASASVDLPPAADYPRDVLTLNGAWARERHVARRPLAPGSHVLESRGGASGHQHAPFIAVLDREATENHGHARALSLMYSGNHRHSVEVDQYGVARMQAGIGTTGFSWQLEPGASLDTPAAALTWSPHGLNGVSDNLHTFVRQALLPPRWRHRDRPIVVNSWEAHYFDVNQEHVVALAREGAAIGAELLVVDDGWFLGRNDDHTSLGDWVPDTTKFPGGLAPVIREVEKVGLQFGLWVEPEMVSPRSDLYRRHPDWAITTPGRQPTEARNQLVLDLGNPAVQDHLFTVVAKLLEDAPIRYLKWDMNRNITEPATGETMHRYILGVYSLLDRLTTAFPDVLIEGCAGGGGRFDYGMLAWTPQFWTSDQTDAIARLPIQHGSSILFPPETMGAHVSAVPNHILGRTTSAYTRAGVALCFNFGFELDLAGETEGDRAVYRHFCSLYRELRPMLRTGRFLRLVAAEGVYSWMVLAAGGERAVVCRVETQRQPNAAPAVVRLTGLDPHRWYTVTPLTLEGDGGGDPVPVVCAGAVLMDQGIPVPPAHGASRGDYSAGLWQIFRDDTKEAKGTP